MLKVISVKNGDGDVFCALLRENMGSLLPMIKEGNYLKARTLHNSIHYYDLYFVPQDIMIALYFKFQNMKNIAYMRDEILMNSEFADDICTEAEDCMEQISVKHYSEGQIAREHCYMIMVSDNKYDVHIAIPANVIQFLLKPTEYHCSVCNKRYVADNSSIETFIPDMRYAKNKGEVKYYCHKCSPNEWMMLGDSQLHKSS